MSAADPDDGVVSDAEDVPGPDGQQAGDEAGDENGQQAGDENGQAGDEDGQAGDEDGQRLDPRQLGVYFVLTEAVSLLQHQIEQQLRAEGDLSYVQFQLLARLADADGPLTMTQLADGVVYSRSGLTYQAGLLEKAGLITRGPSPEDERATLVTITDRGRALFDRVLPGHIQVTRLLFDPLTGDDLHHLGDIMARVRDHLRARPPRSAAPRRRR